VKDNFRSVVCFKVMSLSIFVSTIFSTGPSGELHAAVLSCRNKVPQYYKEDDGIGVDVKHEGDDFGLDVKHEDDDL